MKENEGWVTALYNNKYSNSAPLSFPEPYPRVWEKKDKKIIWVIQSYNYQWISSVNFVLVLTSNKRWDCPSIWEQHNCSVSCHRFCQYNAGQKKEKRNVTLLWSQFHAQSSPSKMVFPPDSFTGWKYFENTFSVFFFKSLFSSSKEITIVSC